MSFHFDPKRAAQATSVLLKCSDCRRHNYTALIKMLYIADRESIRETGSPVTGDRPFALDNGPILSNILNLIKEDSIYDELHRAIWSKYFRTIGFDIELISDPGDSELSDYEVALLERIHRENGQKHYWTLVNETHELPEWSETHRQGTSTEIHLLTILSALGMQDRYDALSDKQIEDAQAAKLFG